MQVASAAFPNSSDKPSHMSAGYLALSVTFGFIVLGVLGKVLAHGWRWSDFYLGMQMALTAVSGSAVYCFDLNRRLRESEPNSLRPAELSNTMDSNHLFLIVALIGYFAIAALHRSWEKDRVQPWKETFYLVGLANGIGAALLWYFILMVREQ